MSAGVETAIANAPEARGLARASRRRRRGRLQRDFGGSQVAELCWDRSVDKLLATGANARRLVRELSRLDEHGGVIRELGLQPGTSATLYRGKDGFWQTGGGQLLFPFAEPPVTTNAAGHERVAVGACERDPQILRRQTLLVASLFAGAELISRCCEQIGVVSTRMAKSSRSARRPSGMTGVAIELRDVLLYSQNWLFALVAATLVLELSGNEDSWDLQLHPILRGYERTNQAMIQSILSSAREYGEHAPLQSWSSCMRDAVLRYRFRGEPERAFVGSCLNVLLRPRDQASWSLCSASRRELLCPRSARLSQTVAL